MRNGTASGGRVEPETGDCGDPACDACHFARTQGVDHCSKKCINIGRPVGASHVRAPAHVRSGLVAPVVIKPAEPLTVTLDLADALAGGLTIQGLIMSGRVPVDAIKPLKNLSEQLVAAARAAAGMVGR